MDMERYFKDFYSDCTEGTCSQFLCRYDSPRDVTGRTWLKLRAGGNYYSFLFQNQIDSTYSDGSESRANLKGGEWFINRCRVGLCSDIGDEPSVWSDVLFNGNRCRQVSAGEGLFCSDPASLNASPGDFLCYEISLTGNEFPSLREQLHRTVVLENGEWVPSCEFPLPAMIGSDRKAEVKLGFLGDSITQGLGTGFDAYEHWVAGISAGIPSEYSVWNLGIGFGRGHDAASDCSWLNKAKKCDIVNICFGVNDLCQTGDMEQLYKDLTKIVLLLKEAGCKTILFTVPPFDLQGELGDKWYEINRRIRTDIGLKADGMFDFADILGWEEPDKHLSRYGGHPNAVGCAAVTRAYLDSGILFSVLSK